MSSMDRPYPRLGQALARLLVLAFAPAGLAIATPLVVDFADVSLAANSFHNGGPSTNTTGWSSNGVSFGNSFDASYGGFWNGFSYSNVNDTQDGAFTNQYAAFTGTAFSGSIYAVAYPGSHAFVNVPPGHTPASVRVTNTTYTALDMANGSGFSRKFGPGDFLTVTFTGYNATGASGSPTGSVTFYLADFLAGRSTIVNTWELLSLGGLAGGGVPQSIGLSWASSDVGQYGINTPTYAAIDDLTFAPVPEPALPAAAAAMVIALAVAWRRSRDA